MNSQADIAWALFEECEEKDIPLNLNAYNSIIQLVPQLRDSAVARQNLLFELLKKISIAGLKPDIGTFNSALKAVSAMSHRKTSMDLVRSLFTDFKKMGIKPSLASYYYALIAFCNDRHDRKIIFTKTEKYLKTFVVSKFMSYLSFNRHR